MKKTGFRAFIVLSLIFLATNAYAQGISSETRNLQIQQTITEKLTTHLQRPGNQLIDLSFGYWLPRKNGFQTHLTAKFLANQSELLKLLRITSGMTIENCHLSFTEITLESGHSYKTRILNPILVILGMEIISSANCQQKDSEMKRAKVFTFFTGILERLFFKYHRQPEKQPTTAWLDSIRVTREGMVLINGHAQSPDHFFQLGKWLLDFKGLTEFQILNINQVSHGKELLFKIECKGKI